MIICNENTLGDQAERLRHKTQDQQLVNRIIDGTGASAWEAGVFVDVAKEVYFTEAKDRPLRSGEMRYECIAAGEPAGKPIQECRMQTVVLTIQHNEDLEVRVKKGITGLRRMLLLRLTEETREQGGLLSQEDLSRLLFTDVRTIRRDVAWYRKTLDIIIPTRGTVQDIGPGVTHRGVALRHWLSGAEPVEVARKIHHSLTATERYIQHFSRVVYLYQKHFKPLQIAMTVGLSSAGVNTYLEIYHSYKGRKEYNSRFDEIALIGESHHEAEDLKKGVLSLNQNRKSGGKTQ